MHPMMTEQIAGLAALDEPVRRSLYVYVAGQADAVGRDQAARATRVSRSLAGFHLDRLAEEGLLDITFKKLSGKTGPGSGRPAKLYRRSSRQLAISVPPRRYDLASQILVAAFDADAAASARSALASVARQAGERIGAEARARVGRLASAKRVMAETVSTLAAHGYEPSAAKDQIRLRNCPFHALVAEHKALVCGMNLSLVEGVVDGVKLPRARAVLDPGPGRCCVSIQLGKEAPGDGQA